MLLKFRLILTISITLALSISVNAFAAEKNITTRNAIYWQNENLADAIDQWQKEAEAYYEQKDIAKRIETILKISQAYAQLGQHRLSLIELKKAKALPGLNSHTKAVINLGIGNAHKSNGDFEQAISAYQDSLKEEVALSALNNLVRTYQTLKESALLKAEKIDKPEDSQKYKFLAQTYKLQALKYATQALSISEREISSSAVYALIEWGKFKGNKLDLKQLARGQNIIDELPISKSLVYLLINWATVDTQKTVYWLGKAENIASKLKAPELQSYVNLELGYFFQKKQNWTLALKYADEAYSKSQAESTNDSNYRSLKLMGDLHLQMGKKELALKNYRDTILAIDYLNKTISSTNAERTIKFNREIQPVYKKALSIILEQPKTSLAELKEALVISDKLRLSQLKSYFGEDCFEVANNYSSPKKGVATINSIVLHDQVFFVLQLPDGEIIKSSRKIAQSKLTESAKQWREELKTGFSWGFRDRSHFFYNLIIEPFELELESANSDIKVLVFVHDGVLRNIPMAALLDGDDYLIEKWPISSSLGLKISPKPNQTLKVNALIFGLSDPPQSKWGSLDGVPKEVEQIGELIDSSEYLNSGFTFNNLAEQLKENNYSILHLATHGYFGGTAESSFVLAYDREIPIPKLEKLLQNSKTVPNLLVLSACETAVGSELSVLGLAGIAAKSGVDSTLGSLWQVGDEAQLEVIHDFYSAINGNLSNKEEALRQVQIKQIREFAHPDKWASLNLIGNY